MYTSIVHDPTVSVLVLNLTGRADLETCLASLDTQTYPRDRFHVVAVDHDAHRGVCASYNAAVRSCDSDFVALLSSDARVDRDWLAALVSVAGQSKAAAVASKILDWSGDTIDFVGSTTSFVGHPWPVDVGAPATRTYEQRPLLFPCTGSTLCSRAAFLDAGGFDEQFFAGFEDVDLGWRLNLFGETIVLAPHAVTYRRGHGSSSLWALAQRRRLYERNALATIYKHYESATLERVFPAAVALLLLRASTGTGIERLALGLSERPPDRVETHPNLAAHLIGLEDFCRQLPALRTQRDAIQQRRRRSDAALFELFGNPLQLHEIDGSYQRVANALIRELGIDEIFAPARQAPPRATVPRTPEQPLRPSGRTARPGDLPVVSVVILTALGATHLRECLDSLSRQTYPAELIHLVVVDNGSAEDPSPEVLARFPGAHVIRNPTNVGFAAGNNQGAAAASGEYLIFLNDDTRQHADWLRQLVATARRRNAAAAASYILDWSGTRVDFADGAVNFQGKGFQLEYDTVAKGVREEKPLLFACGCAMLVDRAVFEEVGGWDEGAFAYYEDVELGWRLHVLGYSVWFAPAAVVYHKHHGTSGGWAEPPRVRLYERNSLRNLFCLLEGPSLRRALAAALLLAADRALLETGLSRAADSKPASLYHRLKDASRASLRARGISRSTPLTQAVQRVWQRGLLSLVRDIGRSSMPQPRSRRDSYLIERGRVPLTFDTEPQPIPVTAAAMLSGVNGFLNEMPQLLERRGQIQRRRQVDDRDLLERFGTHWTAPSASRLQAEHKAMHDAIVDEFEIAAIRQPATIENVSMYARK
jgi:GT2 family glycosyltransferase